MGRYLIRRRTTFSGLVPGPIRRKSGSCGAKRRSGCSDPQVDLGSILLDELDKFVRSIDLIRMSDGTAVLHDFAGLDSNGTTALNDVRSSVTKYLQASAGKPASTDILFVLVSDLVGQRAIGMLSKGLPQALMAGAQRRNELLRANGGVESSDAAARRLGMSKQAVLDRAKRGTLLGLRTLKQNAVVFPMFQFAPDAAGLVAGLDEVLRVLNEQPALDGWAKCNFLLSARDSLRGKSPLVLLREGHVGRVVNLAWAYAQS